MEDLKIKIGVSLVKIHSTLESWKGRTFGEKFEGGKDMMAKALCIRAYYGAACKFILEKIPSVQSMTQLDALSLEDLSEYSKKLETIVYFIDRSPDNFQDFYKEIDSPGHELYVVEKGTDREVTKMSFNEIDNVKF